MEDLRFSKDNPPKHYDPCWVAYEGSIGHWCYFEDDEDSKFYLDQGVLFKKAPDYRKYYLDPGYLAAMIHLQKANLMSVPVLDQGDVDAINGAIETLEGDYKPSKNTLTSLLAVVQKHILPYQNPESEEIVSSAQKVVSSAWPEDLFLRLEGVDVEDRMAAYFGNVELEQNRRIAAIDVTPTGIKIHVEDLNNEKTLSFDELLDIASKS